MDVAAKVQTAATVENRTLDHHSMERDGADANGSTSQKDGDSLLQSMVDLMSLFTR